MAYPIYEDNGGLSSGSGSLITATYPSGISANDILIFTACKDVTTSTNISSGPSGFSYVHTTSTGDSVFTMAAYWKRATGSESGTVSLTWSEAPASFTGAIINNVSRCITTSNPPIDGVFWLGAASGTGTTTSATILGGTTTGNQRLLINILMASSNIGVTTASGWTEEDKLSTSTVTTKTQTRQVPTATTIGNATSTLSSAARYVADSIALVPAPAWPHNFLGVDNEDIRHISKLGLEEIEAVNTIT
jgi:hypothetical protein